MVLVGHVGGVGNKGRDETEQVEGLWGTCREGGEADEMGEGVREVGEEVLGEEGPGGGGVGGGGEGEGVGLAGGEVEEPACEVVCEILEMAKEGGFVENAHQNEEHALNVGNVKLLAFIGWSVAVPYQFILSLKHGGNGLLVSNQTCCQMKIVESHKK